MAEFFRASTVWVIDFRYEGRPRRWFKVFDAQADAQAQASSLLHDLYEGRAQLVAVRQATDVEELQYLRGEEPKNLLCPTGRHP
ncbi:MAG: hypothetical protein Q8K96_09385 [Rubrivivax sp.]|nr:hypothetical protein [Rubrivivax sp.]